MSRGKVGTPQGYPVIVVDGRRVIDELPPCWAVSPGEITLVSQHLHAIVACLFGMSEEVEE